MKHFTYILLSILTLGAIGSCQLDTMTVLMLRFMAR